MKKGPIPIEMNRRQVLSGMAAFAGAPNPAIGLPVLVDAQAVAAAVAQPRSALITLMGLQDLLRGLHLSPELAERASYGNRNMNHIFIENVREKKAKVAHWRANPHPLQAELELITQFTGFGGGSMGSTGRLDDWAQRNDSNACKQLLRLSPWRDDAVESATRSVVPQLEHLEYHILRRLEEYREQYGMFRQVEAAIQQQPRVFVKALRELHHDIPSLFPANGTYFIPADKLQLNGWIDQLENVLRAPRSLIAPEELETQVWQQFGRLTGKLPQYASAEVQEQVARVVHKPGYRPYLSKEAQLARDTASLRKWADRLTMDISATEKSYEIYLPDATGHYDQALDMVPLPAMRVDIASKGSRLEDGDARFMLLALRDHINANYPLDPVLNTVARHDKKPRAELYGELGLMVTAPSAELQQWLRQLARPQTRVEAVQRLGKNASVQIG